MKVTAAKVLDLECPKCGAGVPVPPKLQVEGEPVVCLNCAAELVLAQHTETEGESWQWTLVDLEEESRNEK